MFATINDIDDPYDCCVACQTNAAGCGGYLYGPGYCAITTYNTQCDPDNFGLTFATSSTVAGDGQSGFTIGNGPCGQIANGGNRS